MPRPICPNHPGEHVHYVTTTKQYFDIIDVLDSGYVRIDESPLYDSVDDETLECDRGCILDPTAISADPALLIDM